MKTLLYTLSFVLVSTWGVAQITTGHFGANATLDNVTQPNVGQTTNKWIRIAELTLNGNWSPAGITVDFFPRNSNHGDSRQELNVQFRNSTTGIENTPDISLVTFYGTQKTIKDVKVVHTSGSGVSNNTFSVWVQMGISWLDYVPIEVRTYGNVTFETTNQPYYTSITDTGTVYDLISSYSMVKSNNTDALTIKDNGNVGIGTTNPAEKLTIKGTDNYFAAGQTPYPWEHTHTIGVKMGTDATAGVIDFMRWTGTETSYGTALISQYNSDGGYGLDFRIDNRTTKTRATTSRMFISSSGEVGIGTVSPQAKLHIANGTLRTWTPLAGTVGIFESTAASRSFVTITGQNQAELWFGDGAVQALGRIRYEPENNLMEFWTAQSQKMVLDSSGNLGIGTTSPSEKLSVNGSIRSHEVKVEIENWPDYVFKNDYTLLSLADVKKHIATKGHLPNMPSATVIKEEGAALGALNVKLLEKIEELTLYTLEQEAQLQQQQHINKTLMERLSQIESKLNQHEKPTP